MVANTPVARLLLDTNVVVGALLWRGPPEQLMSLAVEQELELISSPVLLAELRRTFGYPRLAKRLAALQTDVDTLMHSYQAIVTQVDPEQVERVVPGDSDDDHVIAAAVAAQAQWIVSGDRHLLSLGSHQGVAILGVRQALERLAHA
jgi:uncharacterized protein